MLKAVENTQMSFNYDVIPEPVAVQAREAAQRIRLRLRRSAEDIIEIGRDLLAVKERIGHGNFLPWIEAEFGMSDKTAQKMMQVARLYGGKVELSSNLDLSALYELAAPKTPIEVREEIERMIEAGEVVTKATVTSLKAELETAKRGRNAAEADAEIAEEKAGALKEGLDNLNKGLDERVSVEVAKAADKIRDGYQEEIDRLKQEIVALRAPRNVTTIDNSTGNVVSFARPLSDEDAAKIDAEYDEFTDGDFNEVASDQDKAVAFFGCVRSIAKMSANPRAVYHFIKAGRSPELVAEYMAMVDQAFSQLKSIKDHHNG